MIPLIILFIIAFALFSDAYLKPTIFRYLIMIFSSIFGLIVGFNYYEMVAAILIEKEFMSNMAQGLSFIVITAISFAIFKSIGDYTIRQEIKFPATISKTISYILSFILAIIVTGIFFVFFAMLPMAPKYPYPRFANLAIVTDVQGNITPQKSLASADSLVVGIFSAVSRGSFSAQRSFDAVHCDFLDACYLNRHKIKDTEQQILAITGTEAIKINMSDKNTVRKAHTSLRSEEGKSLPEIAGKELYVIKCPFSLRLEKNGGAMGQGVKFELLPCQLRIICNDDYEYGVSGSGIAVYPYGSVVDNKLSRMNLLTVTSFDLAKSDIMDLYIAFYVPAGQIPVAVAYKQNFITQLPKQPDKEDTADAAQEN